ncbi:CyP450 monooxygenase [Lenzites betulinus]|nr:CyP450 monooxygenase [Lenzites betulinus]
MPAKVSGEDYRAISEKYGDIVFLQPMNQKLLLLGSHAVAVDLLEKRSALYSDRASTPIVELGGFSWTLVAMGYGAWWRRHRRAFHQFFNREAVVGYHATQEAKVDHFLGRLLQSPSGFNSHIKQLFTATVFQVVYGIEVTGADDKYAKLGEEALEATSPSHMLVPGKYLVEVFPFMKYIPAWMPGAHFPRDVAVAKKALDKLRDVPWAHTLAEIREGTATPSITTKLMEHVSTFEGEEAAEEEIVARNTAGVAYGAGADTITSSIQALFLVLTLHPEIQQKARAELDAVVGPHRLPGFADQDALPYVSAVIKELTRWHVIAPLGFPHRLIQDDEYRGYHIPKGTLVMPNVWAFSRDERVYPNAGEFLPERYLKDGKLNPDVLDAAEFFFGYGRRSCPGRHFTEAAMFLVVSSLLHTFDISPPLDDAGVPVMPSGKFTTGVLTYPEPFDCVIKPRAAWAEALIRSRSEASKVSAAYAKA